MIRSFCLAAAAALLLAVPASANACWPHYGACGAPWSQAYGYTSNYGGYIPAPPYYSVFPPVYYSAHVTKRHYGASPYAWQAGMQPVAHVRHSPMAAPPAPMMIENPYVKGARGTSLPADEVKLEVQPLRIDNPFVAARR
jgi:hypothetical protein